MKASDSINLSLRQLAWLLLISSVAFLLRYQVCSELFQNDSAVTNPPSYTDMSTYIEFAKKLVAGTYNQEFYYQPFCYAVFLYSLFLIAGENLWLALVVQSLVSSLTVLLCGCLAWKLFSFRAGLLAALMLALTQEVIFYSAYILPAVWLGLGLLLLLYFCIRYHQSRSLLSLAALSLILSFMVLARGSNLLFLPAVILLVFFSTATKKQAVGHILAVVVLFALPQTPFSYANYQHGGAFVGSSTAGATTFALSNDPEAPPAGQLYSDTYEDWKEEGRLLPRTLEWISTHPLSWVELEFKKFLFYLRGESAANNVGFVYQRHLSNLLAWPILLPNAFLLLFGLAGFVYFMWPRTGFDSSSLKILYFVTGLYSLSVLLFCVLERYLVPFAGLLAILAAGYLDQLGLWLRSISATKGSKLTFRRFREALLHFSLVLSALFLVVAGYDFYVKYFEKHTAKFLRPDGLYIDTVQRQRLLDHGPIMISNNHWETRPLDLEKTIIKQFVLPQNWIDYPAGKFFVMYLASGKPEQVKVSLVDGELRTELAAARSAKFRTGTYFEIPSQVNIDKRELVFELSSRAGDVVEVYIDKRRDYGRTWLAAGGSGVGGELAARLEVVKGDPD